MLIMRISHENENKRSFIKKVLIGLFLMTILMQPISALADYTPVLDPENEEDRKPALVEKHLSKFFLNVANSLIAIMQAQDVSVLVFQREDVINEDDSLLENKANAFRDDLTLGVFPQGLFNGIARIYDIFIFLLPIPVVVLIALGGLVLLLDLLKNPESMSKAKEILFGIVITTLLLRFGHIAWDWIIRINYFIVDTVYVALKGQSIEVTSFLSTVWNPTETEDVMSSGSFTTAILVVCALFMTFILNYQYMMRMITLGMLVALFPLVILSAIIPSRRNVLNTWFTNFTSQIFMQSAHAIALGLFFFAISNAEDLNFWFVFTMFFALPAMSDLVQRIVSGFTGEGDGGGGLGRSIANGSGMAGLMGVGMMAKGIFSEKGGSSKDVLENKTKTAEGVRGQTDRDLNGYSVGQSNTMAGGESTDSKAMANQGVGSAPVGNGLTKSRPRGMAAVGSNLAKTGKKMAKNPNLGRIGRVTAVGGMAALGAMAGTMVSGKGANGTVIGGAVGLGGAYVAGSMKGKTGKGIQVLGEGIQSNAQGLGVMDLTKERLGFHDKSQLSNPQEMKRMGEELIGGWTGSTLGSVIGNANYTNDALLKDHYEPSKENYDLVNQQRDLDWEIGQKEEGLIPLKYQQMSAKKDLEVAVAQHGEGSVEAKAKKEDYHKQNVNYLTSEQEVRKMKEKRARFYAEQQQRRQKNLEAINNHANATRGMQNRTRSSGQP